MISKFLFLCQYHHKDIQWLLDLKKINFFGIKYHSDLKKREDLRYSLVLLGVTPLWHVAQWVSRAPMTWLDLTWCKCFSFEISWIIEIIVYCQNELVNQLNWWLASNHMAFIWSWSFNFFQSWNFSRRKTVPFPQSQENFFKTQIIIFHRTISQIWNSLN